MQTVTPAPPFGTSVRAALRVYVPWRILLSVWAALVVWQFPVTLEPGKSFTIDYFEAAPDDTFISDYILEPWLRWDAEWYTHIARYGYAEARPAATAFSPLYPALIAPLARLLNERYMVAALIISNLAAFGALVLLHRLVTLIYDTRLANRTLLMLVLFPASYYLLAPYTEPLFLLLVAGSFLAAYRKRWALAGIIGALATLARWQGVLIVLALGWQFVEDRRAGRPWQDWRTWTLAAWREWLPALWLGLLPLAMLGTFGYFKALGLPLYFEQFESEWNGTFSWPWVGLLRTPLAFVGAIDQHGSPVLTLITDWTFALLFLALLIAALRQHIKQHDAATPRRLTAALLIYAWAQYLLPVSRLVEGDILEALTRHLLLIFPAFILLGIMSERHRWLERLLFLGGVLLTLVYSGMYFVWLWVA